MNRINAILRKKLEKLKIDHKIKRVNNALEAAKLNAETELMGIDTKLEEAVEELSTATEVTTVIEELKKIFEDREDIKEGLKIIELIKNYLNEEVELPKDDD